MKAKPSPKPGRAGGKALAWREGPRQRTTGTPQPGGGHDGPHTGRKLRAAPTTAPATHTASLTPTPPASEPEDCEFPDPEAANHALLVLIHEDEEAAHLRPCDIEQQTGIKHQHHLKMRPMSPAEGKEMRVSFFTVVKWCKGRKKSVRKLIDRLLAIYPATLPR